MSGCLRRYQRLFLRCVCVVFCFVLAGCATQLASVLQNQPHGTLVIQRGSGDISVLVDGRDAFGLMEGCQASFRLAPGEYTILANYRTQARVLKGSRDRVSKTETGDLRSKVRIEQGKESVAILRFMGPWIRYSEGVVEGRYQEPAETWREEFERYHGKLRMAAGAPGVVLKNVEEALHTDVRNDIRTWIDSARQRGDEVTTDDAGFKIKTKAQAVGR